LGSAQYLVDVICRAPKTFGVTWSIGHEAPASDKIASAEDRWKPRAQGKRKDAHEIGDHKLIDCNIKRVRVSPQRLEGRTEIPHPGIPHGTLPGRGGRAPPPFPHPSTRGGDLPK